MSTIVNMTDAYVDILEIARVRKVDADLKRKIEELTEALNFQYRLSERDPKAVPYCRTTLIRQLQRDINFLQAIRNG